MDTNEPKIFKGHTGNFTAEEIIAAGIYFSGIVYDKNEQYSWLEFNLVNKEKIKYILNDIDFKNEVKIEIFAYAKYPKNIQRSSDWDKPRR